MFSILRIDVTRGTSPSFKASLILGLFSPLPSFFGTDATGFYNIEFHVDIYPEKEWESKLTKLELIDKMQDDLSIYER